MEQVIVELAKNNPILATGMMAMAVILPMLMPLLTNLQISVAKGKTMEEAKELDAANKLLAEEQTKIRKYERDSAMRDMKDDYNGKIQLINAAVQELSQTCENNNSTLEKHLGAHDMLNEKFFGKLEAMSIIVNSIDKRMGVIEAQLKMKNGGCHAHQG